MCLEFAKSTDVSDRGINLNAETHNACAYQIIMLYTLKTHIAQYKYLPF